MRWRRNGDSSGDVIDARGSGPGLGTRVALPVGGGISGVILLLLTLFLGFGGSDGTGWDVNGPLDGLPSAPAGRAGADDAMPDPQAEQVQFVSFVLDDVQTFWKGQFERGGRAYQPAKLVIFTRAVQSGCGQASSQTGPFYCPLDHRAYMDLEFFRELSRRFGAPGDFAQAYVIAHELGHHVQTLTGTSEQVQRLAQQNPDQANELSVRQELQADCLAGVWAHSTAERKLLEAGDLEEGLNAASAVGDDRIQAQAGQGVNPETWTHGSAEQRTRWFLQGFERGDPGACDTYSVERV
jgi:uncharacterized protein